MNTGIKAAIVLAVTGLAVAAGRPAGQAADPLREQAHRLHRQMLVLDAHADLGPFLEMDSMPALITDPGMAGRGYDPSKDPGQAPVVEPWRKLFPPPPWRFTDRHADEHTYEDLPRMREGGVKAQFVAVYMDREPRPGMAVKRAFDQIDGVLSVCEKYPQHVGLATTAAEVRRIVDSGRIALLIGVEGGYMIEDDLRILRLFNRLGVRYLTLTHSFNTNWADSSGTGKPVPPIHDGLSPFGREVVAEMNRLGMIVDITHVSDKTFYDALAVTKAPVIASHSSVDGVKDHPRNLSDDMLRALARNGGVIHIDSVIKYIDPVENRNGTPLSIFIDHVVHALKVAGPDHVGIGNDYGYDAPRPIGMEDVSKFEEVTYELLQRGVDEATIRKVWGENTLRVMTEVERVAAKLRQQAAPTTRQ
jgi:membrane dipeptidase